MMKVDLITGFLGAGKTTFIRKYAAYLISAGERVHIIENEFGGLHIDVRLLRDANLDVSRIYGGCLCCTSRATFQGLLAEAASKGFDRVLVEPSGIYDAHSFLTIVRNAPVNTFCEIGSIITVVEPGSEALLSEEARYLLCSQLMFAGAVVVSKTQLYSTRAVDAALRELQNLMDARNSSRDLLAEGICLTKPWEDLEAADFERLSTCGYRSMETAYESMDYMGIFNTVLLGGRFDTREHLRTILETLMNTEKYGKIYRIKGYISDLERNWFEISCSPGGCFIRPAHIKKGLFLVIGQNCDEEAIKNLFYPVK